MNNRDELADIVADYDGWHPNEAADRILAAGYRKPRTITTEADLDSLPNGATIKTLIGGQPAGRAWGKIEGVWWGMALECPDAPVLPAVVLWEPNQ